MCIVLEIYISIQIYIYTHSEKEKKKKNILPQSRQLDKGQEDTNPNEEFVMRRMLQD